MTSNQGNVKKAALHRLLINGNFDIEDLVYEDINFIQEQYFPHRTVHNFWCNFKNLSGTFNLEQDLSGAWYADEAPGKMCCLFNY